MPQTLLGEIMAAIQASEVPPRRVPQDKLLCSIDANEIAEESFK